MFMYECMAKADFIYLFFYSTISKESEWTDISYVSTLWEVPTWHQIHLYNNVVIQVVGSPQMLGVYPIM